MAVLGRRLLRFGLVLLAVLAVSAQAAEPDEGPKEPTPEEVAAHHERGQVWFGDEWRTVGDLLEACRSARKAEDEHRLAADAAQAKVGGFTKALAERTSAYRAATQPLEREKAQAEAVQKKARRVLMLRPPREPSVMKAMRGADAYVQWEVERANRERLQQYERALERYNELHEQAAEAFKKAQETVDRCNGELAGLREVFETDRKPLLTGRTETTADLRRARRDAGTLRARVLHIAAALREVPNAVRLRAGAVEWRDEFYTLDDLRSMLERREAKIGAERKELEEKLAGEGRSLPATWTHPDRAEADALKARIAGAEVDIQKAGGAAQ